MSRDNDAAQERPVVPRLRSAEDERSPIVPPDGLATASALSQSSRCRLRISSWTISFFLGAATLCMYLVIDRYAAILPWLSTFALLVWGGTWWDRRSQQDGRLLRLLITSYLFVSLVGMLDVSDNMRHYGTMFGGGADDSEYFFNTRTILQDGVIPTAAGLYEAVLAVWGFLPNLIWKETTSAFEYLPLNWALAAVIVGLCGELCFVVVKGRPPFWLLALTLLGNYKFTDAVIHLYRDGLLLVFFLLALISVLRSQNLRSIIYSLPVLVLRGANFALYLFVFLLSLTLGNSRTRMRFYAKTACLLAVVVPLLPIVGFQAMKYGSRLMLRGFEADNITSSFGQEMELRQLVLAQVDRNTVQNNTTFTAMMASNSPAAMVLRPITFELIPIRFWPLEMGGESGSRFAATPSSDDRITLRNVYLWLCIGCWAVVVPLLIVGLAAAALGSRKLNILLIYYLVGLSAVSFISFEGRHTAAFIIIHPLLAMLGYKACRDQLFVRIAAIGIGAITVAGIVAYNSFAGSLL